MSERNFRTFEDLQGEPILLSKTEAKNAQIYRRAEAEALRTNAVLEVLEDDEYAQRIGAAPATPRPPAGPGWRRESKEGTWIVLSPGEAKNVARWQEARQLQQALNIPDHRFVIEEEG